MRLSASLLALVAAVPPLVSAAPMDGGGDPPVPGYYYLPVSHPDEVKHAIWTHINLAEIVVTYIAKHFANPPQDGLYPVASGDDDSEAVLCVNGHGRLKELHASDSEFDPDVGGLIDFGSLSLDDPGVSDELRCPCVLNANNFETDAFDRRVHVLSEGALRRLPALMRFYWTIKAFVFPVFESLEWPDAPTAVAGSRLSNAELREWLLSAKGSLFQALIAKFNADMDVSQFPWRYWKSRMEYLDLAIGHVQIYVNDPLSDHGAALKSLFDKVYVLSQQRGSDLLARASERLAIANNAALALYPQNKENYEEYAEDEEDEYHEEEKENLQP